MSDETPKEDNRPHKLDYNIEAIRKAIRQIESLYVKIPRYLKVRGLLENSHQHSKFSADPICVLLIGDTGVGKTTCTLGCDLKCDSKSSSRVRLLLPVGLPFAIGPRDS